MTTSAFGVEHGLISKRLPSALRKPVSEGAQGWEANAMIHRRNAHHAGTNARGHMAAAKKYGQAEWAGLNRDRAGSQGRYYGTRSKNLYRESLENIKRGKTKKRELP